MKHLISILLLGIIFACNSSVKTSVDTFDQEFEEKFKDELKELEELEESDDWKKISPNGNELQCPCCDYFTLGERGAYEICPICFWEDDGIDLDDLEAHSGPNHITLREGRLNFDKFGACDSTMVRNVITEDQRKNFKYEKRSIK